jgi:hypothetical protein
MWDWTWKRYGGVITAPDGRTCFLQGDEANQLDDELEKCETEDQIQNLLSGYDHVCD